VPPPLASPRAPSTGGQTVAVVVVVVAASFASPPPASTEVVVVTSVDGGETVVVWSPWPSPAIVEAVDDAVDVSADVDGPEFPSPVLDGGGELVTADSGPTGRTSEQRSSTDRPAVAAASCNRCIEAA